MNQIQLAQFVMNRFDDQVQHSEQGTLLDKDGQEIAKGPVRLSNILIPDSSGNQFGPVGSHEDNSPEFQDAGCFGPLESASALLLESQNKLELLPRFRHPKNRRILFFEYRRIL